MARALVATPRLTVVTNSLNIASELAVRPNLKLVVTGGVARAESYELVGPLAESALAGLNLDLVLVGVDGISARAGLTTHHEVEAHTNRALIDRASVVIVVADSSKLGVVAFAQICELGRVTEVITDAAAAPDAVAELTGRGRRVTVVRPTAADPLRQGVAVGVDQLLDDRVDGVGRERCGRRRVEQRGVVDVVAAALERRAHGQLADVQERAG